MINETCVDILFYLSKGFRTIILQKIVLEANKFYAELMQGGKNKRFKGKVAWVGHSLGTVITYDLLLRQIPKKKEGHDAHEKDHVEEEKG